LRECGCEEVSIGANARLPRRAARMTGCGVALLAAVLLAAVLLLVGLLSIAYTVQKRYVGTLEDATKRATLPANVRKALSVLPPEARAVDYVVHTYRDPWMHADFPMSTEHFLAWMQRKGWEPEEIPREFPFVVVSALDGREVTVVKGYYYTGMEEGGLNLKDSVLQVTVVFDAERGRVYYSHLELLDPPKDNYGNRTDKYRHCWLSCKMSRTCGGVLTQLAGLGKEARDAVKRIMKDMDGGTGDWFDSLDDLVANQKYIGWESYVFGIVGGWVGAFCRESCDDCCDRHYD